MSIRATSLSELPRALYVSTEHAHPHGSSDFIPRSFPTDTLAQEIQDLVSMHQSLSQEGGETSDMPVYKELSEEKNDHEWSLRCRDLGKML